jgi:uncharacterized protein (TIGR03118 family)
MRSGPRCNFFALALMLGGGGCSVGERSGTGDLERDIRSQPGTSFRRVDLVSDQRGAARRVDPDVVNAWGIVPGEGGLWIADEGTGKLSIFNGAGKPARGEYTSGAIDLGEGITGIAANPTAGFAIHAGDACAPAELVIASTTGRLFGVSGDIDPTRGFVLVDRAGSAIYTGVAIGRDGDQPRLYAADFKNGQITVFDAELREIRSSVAFVDPGLPAGYTPFNVASLAGHIYVAYAQRDPEEPDDEAHGPGLGLVDVYEPSGSFVRRLVTGGELNAPWGMAIAPAGFGAAGGMLLVGNLGDGRIHPFDLGSGRSSGALSDKHGQPIEIDGLWGITFGGGEDEDAGDPDVLYFAAGPDDEMHGLFGRIEVER